MMNGRGRGRGRGAAAAGPRPAARDDDGNIIALETKEGLLPQGPPPLYPVRLLINHILAALLPFSNTLFHTLYFAGETSSRTSKARGTRRIQTQRCRL